MFETMLPIIPDQWKSLSDFCPYKEILKARSSRTPRMNLSQNKPVQNGVQSEEAVGVGHENKKDLCLGKRALTEEVVLERVSGELAGTSKVYLDWSSPIFLKVTELSQ